jgi:hypothetical protein
MIPPFTPPPPPKPMCSWLVFDFGRPVRLDEFRVYPHGDGVHDISSHYMDAREDSKWSKVGPSFGGVNNSAAIQEYSFPVTSAREWRWVITRTFPSVAAAGPYSRHFDYISH